MGFRKLVPLLILILCIFLAACNNGDAASIEDVAPIEDVESIDEVEEQQLVIPAPGEDTGVVYGKIVSEATGRAPEANVYLSRNLTAGEPDLPAMISFSYQTNPRAQVDDDGNFYFSDVPVGVYAITIWTHPSDTLFIETEDGQDYLWVEVEAGAILDLGLVQAP